MQNDWLDEGAVHVLLPLNLLEKWHGSDSDDYDRACTVNGWLDLLSVGDGSALVLGGDPGMVLADRQGDSVLLIRWIYADDEAELIRFARNGAATANPEPDVRFDNSWDQWRLFDAAVNPTRVEHAYRTVRLPIGPIQIRTELLQSERNSAIVHRFVPLT